jgi:cytochrome c peroxidase
MKNRKLFIVSVLLVAITAWSFALLHSPKPIPIKIPSNFPSPVYDLTINPITEEGFALGRQLFYEPLLSRDSNVSCGSCHQQSAAFIQAGHDFSHGVDNLHGRRNALPIFNALFYKTFFWDGGVHNLDMVPVNPIENRIEMDEKVDNVLRKLNTSSQYRMLFKQAFKTDSITSKEFLQAFAQFMAAMISANSRYDKYVRNEGESLNSDELNGLAIFKQKCSSCHATDLFTDGSYRNNGITNDFRFDKGREEITLNESDKGKFKVPTLRNIEYTAPYMHNGSLATLEDVLQHYTSGMKPSKTVDSAFCKNNGTFGIDLTADEQKNLIAFLKTLSDKEFITDKRYSEQ